MGEGTIVKALSGFYYVKTPDGIVECKARGRFRLDGTSPLVGDRVRLRQTSPGKGTVTEVLPRINRFARPAVANIDLLAVVASGAIPKTDPFLIDRVAAIAELNDCDVIVCVNKSDLEPGDNLFEIYRHAGFTVIRTSAVTGEGIAELREAISGRTLAFTGNSGVGKSSLLNRLDPAFEIQVGEVSQKLGRGRHTTRHVELFPLDGGTFIADTPGFASFDIDHGDTIAKDRLQYAFREFSKHLGNCRFNDCAHLSEPDCAVTRAVRQGEIGQSRYCSYTRLYELAAQQRPWELD